MAEVIWHPRAEDDLRAIHDYIAHDSPTNARLFIASLVKSTERLSRYPQSGTHHRDYVDPRMRHLRHGRYRIIYRDEGDKVLVLKIHHEAMLYDPGSMPES